MNWHTVKLSPADTYFSRYLRLKAKKCVYCGKPGTGEDGIFGLQASHFHSRRKESVRFDLENVDSLCIGCHRKLGTDDREAYRAFKLKQLGQKKYDLLNLRAETYAKRDRKMQVIIWKKMLEELE